MDAENSLDTFISKAKASGGAERANYQLFVVELCEVLCIPRPEYASEDTALDNYVFERKVAFAHPDGSTTSGWIHCYRRDHFILEAKQSKKRTAAAADGLGLPLGFFPARVRPRPARDAQMGPGDGSGPKQAEDYSRALR